MADTGLTAGVVGIGSAGLQGLRQLLTADIGADGAAARLQEFGYAAGEQLYQHFVHWLGERTGITDPADLDSEVLGEVLTSYFTDIGWGAIEIEQLGGRALGLSSSDWAEANPSEGGQFPSCYITTGMLASFLTALSGGHPLAAMEVECRSQGDTRCRFLAGSPDTLEAVYQAAAEGKDFEAVVRG